MGGGQQHFENDQEHLCTQASAYDLGPSYLQIMARK